MTPRLVVVSLLVFAGCGCSSSSPDVAVDGPVMRYTTPYETDGMAALVRGVLELEGACLYLVADHGERFPVLWPAGSSWDSDGQAVLPPEGASMPIGSAVDGGGGYLTVTDVERLAGPDAAALAARCVDNTYGEIAIVNNQRDAIALALT